MAKLINLETFNDDSGSLTVIEKILPFDIKRVYYMYNVSQLRGGHKHIKTIQALISINGSCEIFSDNGIKKESFLLNSPSKCLIVEPQDWHTMDKFSKNAVLLVLASELYDIKDYIYEGYE